MNTQLAPAHHRFAAQRAVWWTFALYPVAFVAAFVVGEGLLSLYGHDVSGVDTPPMWMALAAGGPALLLFCVPAALAVHFGRRAAREGHPNGTLAMWLSLGVTALVILQNVLVFLVG